MEAAGIYARESTPLDRAVQIGVAGSKLISVSFPRTPAPKVGGDHPLLDRIVAYLEGEPDDFADVDVGLTVPTNQRAVLETVRAIPYGETATVETVARSTAALDDADSGRETARTALRENPTPLVIPDHRVRDGPSGASEAVEERLRSLEGH